MIANFCENLRDRPRISSHLGLATASTLGLEILINSQIAPQRSIHSKQSPTGFENGSVDHARKAARSPP